MKGSAPRLLLGATCATEISKSLSPTLRIPAAERNTPLLLTFIDFFSKPKSIQFAAAYNEMMHKYSTL